MINRGCAICDRGCDILLHGERISNLAREVKLRDLGRQTHHLRLGKIDLQNSKKVLTRKIQKIRQKCFFETVDLEK